MNLSVSIIVPVYNSEKYLPACIDSILMQTCENFELILIDDGSKDRSWRIIEGYAKKDKRVIPLHQENAGVSVARNNGLDHARGKWICFVDSDDILDRKYLEYFNISSLKQDTISIQNTRSFNDDPAHTEPFTDFPDISMTFKGGNIKVIDKVIEIGTVSPKLFSKEIIDEFHIRFDERFSFHEDHIFFYQYLTHVSKMRVNQESGYLYRIDPRVVSLSKGGAYYPIGIIDATYNKLSNLISDFERINEIRPLDLRRCHNFLERVKLDKIKTAYRNKTNCQLEILKDCRDETVKKYFRPFSLKGKVFKFICLGLPLSVSDRLLKVIPSKLLR